jgi:DNA-directed RNA polymerase specialized sigma24 family protein
VLTPSPHHPDAILARLASDNDDHLRWLRREFTGSFGDEDLADLLQDGFGRATVALKGEQPPTFPDWDHAVAWFRRVCKNTAIDGKRRRDGRRESERAARPTFVPLDPPTEGGERHDVALAVLDDDLEAIDTGSVEREVDEAILEALRRLDDKHARILVWRYEDNLAPEAIMRLEGLDSIKQYEGRHYRAVKALGKALSRLTPGAGCGQARLILRKKPEALLDPAAGAVRIHIEDCAACRAFERQLRGALAVVPLSPAALGAKLILGSIATTTPAVHTAGNSPAASAGQSGSVVKSLLSHPKLAAALAAGALSAGAAGVSLPGDEEGGRRSVTSRPSVALRMPTEGSGVFHAGETPAQHFAHHPLVTRAVGSRQRPRR